MKRLLQSSKAWAVVIGVASVLLLHLVGLSQEEVAAAQGIILKLAGLFIGATAAEDVAAKLLASKKKEG